ncbi:hypothetical protein, partial [Aliivibrio sp. 1S165]|uniref:hypothetical protein n=1 Tax=Aliivibrio sp. 1S165 TaxID=1840086 RepID=UPI00114690B2
MALIASEKIIIIDRNGNLKLINEGEKVLPGEIIVENESGAISVELSDLPEKNNINEILEAISNGEDPSLISEAPAAGEESGSSLTASTEIERIGKSTIAETDFDTSSLEAIGLSRTQSLTLLEQYKTFKDTGGFEFPEFNSVRKIAPSISIREVDENGVINETNAADGIQVEIMLPAGTSVGDFLELRDDKNTVVGKHLITENDITDGKVEITIPRPIDGKYELSADIEDQNGDLGPQSNKSSFEVDTLAGENNAAPVVEIIGDSNDDGVINNAELSGDIDVKVTLPAGAVAGDTITVSNGTTSTLIVLEAEDISAGNVTTTFPSPGEGNEIEVTATLSDQYGNTSVEGSDSATVDTLADAGTVT